MSEETAVNERAATHSITADLSVLDEVATLSKSSPVADAEVLRIEETAQARWSGVRSCCDQDRIDGAVRARVDSWVQEKMFENRHLQWLRFGGNGAATGECTQYGLSSARRCNGYMNIPLFIEFRRS